MVLKDIPEKTHLWGNNRCQGPPLVETADFTGCKFPRHSWKPGRVKKRGNFWIYWLHFALQRTLEALRKHSKQCYLIELYTVTVAFVLEEAWLKHQHFMFRTLHEQFTACASSVHVFGESMLNLHPWASQKTRQDTDNKSTGKILKLFSSCSLVEVSIVDMCPCRRHQKSFCSATRRGGSEGERHLVADEWAWRAWPGRKEGALGATNSRLEEAWWFWWCCLNFGFSWTVPSGIRMVQ